MIKEENINCTLEALILSSPEPVSIKRLCEVMDGISAARVRQGVDDLNNLYMGCGVSFRIRELAGGFQMYVLPDFEQAVKKLLTRQRTIRLSQAALETLAIIAYKQPVTKTDIEHIRGVACDGVLHNLLERRLILMAGRSDGPGRPLLYRSTQEFLKYFGLNRLSDLPRMDEIEEMIRQAGPPESQTVLPLPELARTAESSSDDDESGDNGNGNGNGDKDHAVLAPYPDDIAAADAETESDTMPLPVLGATDDDDPGAELDDLVAEEAEGNVDPDEEDLSASEEAGEDIDVDTADTSESEEIAEVEVDARSSRWSQVFQPEEPDEEDLPALIEKTSENDISADEVPDPADGLPESSGA
ncbi:MAG: SMC-Scp complex subunit ScpB [candidate division Zixibacteria bacterium]|nr:SMC-Scp complex subunit ScpB [candidate division Zixibacteria bacterium]